MTQASLKKEIENRIEMISRLADQANSEGDYRKEDLLQARLDEAAYILNFLK